MQALVRTITTDGAPELRIRERTVEMDRIRRELFLCHVLNYIWIELFLRLDYSIQLAVCQKGVRLEPFLYNIFWPDGSWYVLFIPSRYCDQSIVVDSCLGICECRNALYRSYSHIFHSTTFEQRAEEILTSQAQSLSYCQNTTQTIVTSTATATTLSNSTQAPRPLTSTSELPVGRRVNIAAAIGGSLGGALSLVMLGGIIAILRYRGHLRRIRAARDPSLGSHNLAENKSPEMLANAVTPFLGHYPTVSSSKLLPSECTIH